MSDSRVGSFETYQRAQRPAGAPAKRQKTDADQLATISVSPEITQQAPSPAPRGLAALVRRAHGSVRFPPSSIRLFNALKKAKAALAAEEPSDVDAEEEFFAEIRDVADAILAQELHKIERYAGMV